MTPDEHTIKESFLEVGNGHQIYIHDWGNPSAKTPIMFLHGGPGNGCEDRDKKKFDPQNQRVIFHDQRGAGKSLAKRKLDNNTTQGLVADIEKIAAHLNFEKFLIVGGSWGATLALAYSIAHPTRVVAMIIDGIFTGSQAEVDWLHKGGWRHFYPDIWYEYLENTPKTHHHNPGAYHLKQALSNNGEVAKRSAYAYMKVELALLKLDEQYLPDEYGKFDPSGCQIELYYESNNCFFDEGYILNNVSKLTMPVYIIQGRYDMVCPPSTAYELDEQLPNSKLIWTINGHLRQHEAKNIQALLLDQVLGAM